MINFWSSLILSASQTFSLVASPWSVFGLTASAKSTVCPIANGLTIFLSDCKRIINLPNASGLSTFWPSGLSTLLVAVSELLTFWPKSITNLSCGCEWITNLSCVCEWIIDLPYDCECIINTSLCDPRYPLPPIQLQHSCYAATNPICHLQSCIIQNSNSLQLIFLTFPATYNSDGPNVGVKQSLRGQALNILML